MPLGILELITRVGEANVTIQNIAHAMRRAQMLRGGATEITFGTEAITATQIMNGEGPVGIIVWMPREKVEEIRRSLAAAPSTSENTPRNTAAE